jgi:hypothetical protein
MLPGDEITVYPKIVEPPLFVGATKDTVATAFPDDADTDVGAPGTEILESGITILEVSEIPCTDVVAEE